MLFGHLAREVGSYVLLIDFELYRYYGSVLQTDHL
jgi:hypothetical protein